MCRFVICCFIPWYPVLLKSYAPLFPLTAVSLSSELVDGVKHAVKLCQGFVLCTEAIQFCKRPRQQLLILVFVLHNQDGRLIAAVRVRLKEHPHFWAGCIALLLDDQIADDVPCLL